MNAINAVAWQDGHDTVIPTMIAGFTDSHYFRSAGLVAYGFVPVELTTAQEHTVHGINERIQVKEAGQRDQADG